MIDDVNNQSADQQTQSTPNPEIQPNQSQNNPENQPSEIQAAPPAEETRQAQNFRIIKEKAARAERERDELARRLQEMEAARPQTQAPLETDLSVDNDSYVEGKHLKSVHKEVRQLQEQIKQYQQQSSLQAAEIKLKSTYPDFDSVVSRENIELLNDLDPEMAMTIKASSADMYSKAVTAYKAIKSLGLTQEKTYDVEKNRIQANAAKPRPLASIQPQLGDNPLNKAAAFTDSISEAEKKALFAEMLESRKRIG